MSGGCVWQGPRCTERLKQSVTCEPNVTWLSPVFLSAVASSFAASHLSEESRFSLAVGACPWSCRENTLSYTEDQSGNVQGICRSEGSLSQYLS